MCSKWGTTTHIVPAYSPWVNGLVEGTNKILLHVLKQLCAPNLREDEHQSLKAEDTLKNWPNHLEEAIQIINLRLLPTLNYSPKELLLGLIVNTPPSKTTAALEPIMVNDATTQMAYVAQQWLDRYAEMVAHAIKWKAVFDKRVLACQPGEVTFSKGQLVQIYQSDLDYTFKQTGNCYPNGHPHKELLRENSTHTHSKNWTEHLYQVISALEG